MGSSVSQLEIILDQDSGQDEIHPIPAGSLLRGKVEVDLSAPLVLPKKESGGGGSGDAAVSSQPSQPEEDDPALLLRLYGKEKVHMNRAKSTKHHGTGRARKSAERQLLDLRLTWSSFPATTEADGSTIPAGKHVFPFALNLPATLPSSTYYPRDDNRSRRKMRFRIQYKITATLAGDLKKKTAQRYLWISAAAANPKPPPLPCMLEPVSHNIQKGGFFGTGGGGVFLFGASVDDCRVSRGDFCHLHVACRNDSSAAIQRVVVSLVETLHWGTAATNRVDPATGIAKQTTTLSQTAQQTCAVLNDVKLPGLTKERKGVLGSLVETVLGSQQQQHQLKRQVFDDLICADGLIRLQVPPAARESYAGQLLSVRHLVRIEFLTGYFTNSPVVEIPVYVVSSTAPKPSSLLDVRVGAKDAYHIPTKAKLSALLPANTGVAGLDASDADAAPYANTANDAVPMANAKLVVPTIPDRVIQAPVAANENVIVLGGDAICNSKRGGYNTKSRSTKALEELVAMAAPEQVSLPALLSAMHKSINDLELVRSKLRDPEWVDLVRRMSPAEYGSLIDSVHHGECDQTPVAVLLAEHVGRSSSGRGLTCAHAAAALHHCRSQHRAVMAQRLLPLTVDAADPAKYDLVRAELNEWELMVADGAVQDAIKKSGGSGGKKANKKSSRVATPAS